MSDQFLGEIRMFGGNFAPSGWALCNGQILSIAQNTALFSLMGTTFGGDGQSTFGLPNLQSAAPLHTGGGSGPGLSPYVVGESGGVENVTITETQMPAHSHAPFIGGGGTVETSPADAFFSASSANQFASGATTPMNTGLVGAVAGGGQGHNNMLPFLTINFIIALVGIFPARG